MYAVTGGSALRHVSVEAVAQRLLFLYKSTSNWLTWHNYSRWHPTAAVVQRELTAKHLELQLTEQTPVRGQANYLNLSALKPLQ